MQIFDRLAEHDHEQLIFCHDVAANLHAIIAVHDTTLGPALGGVRMYPYKTEDEAITDVLRLSRGMTYKAAASGLDLGGGKAVIIGDPARNKTEVLFRSFGRYVATLGGRYIAAEDVGISPEDIAQVQLETGYVAGISGFGGSGDPSPFTAFGVLQGMRACLEEVYGSDSLEGRTVAVQGLGHVGYYLCRMLNDRGANLVVADVNPKAVESAVHEFGAKPVKPGEVLSVYCDVLAPCALGAVINEDSIPLLKCSIIAGSANNVLLEARHGEALAHRGILYAPDYIVNAGGLINISQELEGYDEARATQRVEHIYEAVKSLISISKRDGVPTNVAADTLTRERISAAKPAKQPQD